MLQCSESVPKSKRKTEIVNIQSRRRLTQGALSLKARGTGIGHDERCSHEEQREVLLAFLRNIEINSI